MLRRRWSCGRISPQPGCYGRFLLTSTIRRSRSHVDDIPAPTLILPVVQLRRASIVDGWTVG